MSEVEKLRSLLAEAREYIIAVGCPDDAMLDRIDAALAEPVEDYQRERDEARAEVERLRKAVHTRACQLQSVYNVGCVCGADEHQRDLQKLAYQRGAEAMREAAARECWRASDELADIPDMASEQGQAQLCATRIRALPVPEDKP